MRLQLRKYEGGCSICAYDSKGYCHVNKSISSDEFETALAFYIENGYDINLADDKGQSIEIYEINIL